MKVGSIPREQIIRDLPRTGNILFLGTSDQAVKCKVCGHLIPAHSMSWGWKRTFTARSHSACGYYTLADEDAVRALLALNEFKTPPSPFAKSRAFDFQLIQRVKTMEHDSNTGALRVIHTWSFSALGVGLLKLLRNAESGK